MYVVGLISSIRCGIRVLDHLIGQRQRAFEQALQRPKSLGHGGSRLLCWCAVRSATASPFCTRPYSSLFLSRLTLFFFYITVPFLCFFSFVSNFRWRFPIFPPPPFVPQGDLRCSIRSSIQTILRIDHRGSASKCNPSSSRRAPVEY
jgi:hypothetical protein